MSGKPLSHEVTKENGFKKPDRVDRHPRSNNNETSGSDNRSSNYLPDPNDGLHKPKIVPWK